MLRYTGQVAFDDEIKTALHESINDYLDFRAS